MSFRLADHILNCVVYIYPSMEDAKAGKRAGGSGFLVYVKSDYNEASGWPFIVTNSHVVDAAISKSQGTVIRINRQDGAVDYFVRGAKDWTHHKNADLAATPAFGFYSNGVSQKVHRLDYFVMDKWFVDDKTIETENIGIGDEVYTVGRFHLSDGKLQNLPSVRWGSIAQMSYESLKIHGKMQKVYLVECHSINGFSGSPVFVYVDYWKVRDGRDTVEPKTATYFLGVDCGHLPLDEYINELQNVGVGNLILKTWNKRKDLKVSANSAMMAVVPASKVRELLDYEDVVAKRKEADGILERQTDAAKPDDVVPDNIEMEEEDFKETLKKVARKSSPDEPDQDRRGSKKD